MDTESGWVTVSEVEGRDVRTTEEFPVHSVASMVSPLVLSFHDGARRQERR